MQILKPHTSINVSDLNKSIEFYTKLFGVEPMKVKPQYAKFDVALPAWNFSLIEREFDKQKGSLNHFGIQVATTEDVIKAKELMVSRGLSVTDEFAATCCYAVQDKVWVSDPDGNSWEFFCVLSASEIEGACHSETPLIGNICFR